MADLVDYDSDLYVYDDYICYDEPDCEIIVIPTEPTVEGSSGSQAVGEFAVGYPYITPEQLLAQLKALKKKKIKVKITVKVNDKEHMSFTQEMDRIDIDETKQVLVKLKAFTEKIMEKPKNIIVRLKKVEKIS